MSVTKSFNKPLAVLFLAITVMMLPAGTALAGGGMVLKDDACIIEIDFYSAHFTAYQPHTRGNEQFCQQLPDLGETLFVLDYLHPSLKDVPVSLRIIHDVTGQGGYVKLKHVEEIEDIERHTVFYQPPVIRPDASFQVDFNLTAEGSFIGIVTAGHPSTDTIYTAVFPFEVGGPDYGFLLPVIFLLLAIAVVLLGRRFSARNTSVQQGTGS